MSFYRILAPLVNSAKKATTTKRPSAKKSNEMKAKRKTVKRMGQAQEAEHTKKNKKQQGEGGEKGGRRKALINKNMLINVKVRRNTEAQLP